MGCNASLPARRISFRRLRSSKLDNKIKQAIKVLHEKHDNEKETICFERILLKFEKSQGAIKYIKKAFDEFANEKHCLNRESLLMAMSKLHEKMSKEDVIELFDYIDIDGSLSIDFKEFLVAFTVGYVLGSLPLNQSTKGVNKLDIITKDNSSNSSESAKAESDEFNSKINEIKQMLDLIISAFLLFDYNHEGVIRKVSVENIIEEHGHKAGHHNQISAQRWKEMVLNLFFSAFNCLKININQYFIIRILIRMAILILLNSFLVFHLGYKRMKSKLNWLFVILRPNQYPKFCFYYNYITYC